MGSASTPLPSSSSAFFVICLFLLTQFILQSAGEQPSSGCLPFKCGNSSFKYPFTNDSSPRCGLSIINCQHDQKPLLQWGETWLVIGDLFFDNNTLVVRRLKGNQDICYFVLQNFTIPKTDTISYEVKSPSIVAVVCEHDSLAEIQRGSLEAAHPISEVCGNQVISFLNDGNFTQNFQLPQQHSFQNQCRVVRLPVREPLMGLDQNRSDEALLSLLDSEFLIQWKLRSRIGPPPLSTQWKPPSGIAAGGNAYKRTRKGSIGSKALIVSSVIAAVVLGLLFLIYRHKLCFNCKKESDQNVELFFESYESPAPRRYKYSDLKKMTNSFKETLGQGGFGSVFKGKPFDGCPVAVRVLNESKGTGEEFINEVATISRTNHLNIVSLFGFCFKGSKRALIYEFMANGSLEKFIYDRKASAAHPLGWEKLHQIAAGIGRGLEYLHRGCNTRILHFDIKPHNILLDENFCPKISDFGLAKLYLTRESMVSVAGARGTTGYIAPEVCSRNFGRVSYKSDVYSYGMMLLEMVGGRKNIDVSVDNTSEIYFPHWIYKKLEEQGHERLEGFEEIIEEEVARKMILVGLWCIQIDPINRPSMTKVVEMLEGNSGSLVMPPNPFCYQISASMLSPPRS